MARLREDVVAFRELYDSLRNRMDENREDCARARQAAAEVRATSRALRQAGRRVSLPRAPIAASLARRWFEEEFGYHHPRVLSNMKTVISELVNNAYLHGSGLVELRIREHPDRFRIDVIDQGGQAAATLGQQPEPMGVVIVDQLAARWGVREGGTHAWAEVQTQPGRGCRATPAERFG